MVDAIANGFERSHVDIDTSGLEKAWILYGGGPVVAAWGPEIIELREQLWVRLLEEEPERTAGLVAGLSVLASHLNNLRPLAQGAPDNLIRVNEALTRMQRRASEGEA